MGFNHHHPHQHAPEHELHDNYGPEARYAVEREAELPTTKWEEEIARGLEYGLQGADSIVDRTIPTFSRGELPHFAGINTFLKAPYVEDVHKCGDYDVAILGAPFDGGTSARSGARFGPMAIRMCDYLPHDGERPSLALRTDGLKDLGVVDAGDVEMYSGDIEVALPALEAAVEKVTRSGAVPVILGGDHSVTFPDAKGVATCTGTGGSR